MSSQTDLAKAVLAIYIVLGPIVFFVMVRHGLRGAAILGWGYLSLFCTLKLVGSGIQIGDPDSVGADIVSSVGLSPLILATSGILHEARYYRALILAPPSGRSRHRFSKRDILAIVLFHGFIATGVALVATGASGLASAASASGSASSNPFSDPSSTTTTSGASGTTTQSDINNDYTLASVGAGIATAGWTILATAALLTLCSWRRTSLPVSSYSSSAAAGTDSDASCHALRDRNGDDGGYGYDVSAGSGRRYSSSRKQEARRPMWLLLGVIYALPLLGVRVVASLVLFAGKVGALSPAGGNTGLVVGLEIVEEVVVVVILTIAGLVTRGLAVGGKA